MEENELVISTKEGFMLINVIRKMNIKDKLIACIGELLTNQKEKEKAFLELRVKIIEKYNNYNDMTDKEKEDASNDILSKNTELAKKIGDLVEEENKIGVEILFLVIENIPNAEKDVYKTLGAIYSLNDEEVKGQPLDVTMEQIKGIIKSKTFNTFFKLAIR